MEAEINDIEKQGADKSANDWLFEIMAEASKIAEMKYLNETDNDRLFEIME